MGIYERLKAVIYRVSNSDSFTITKNTNLVDDLGFDSVSIVSLIVEIEDEFNIVLEDEDLEIDLLSNVGTLENIISKKLTRNRIYADWRI